MTDGGEKYQEALVGIALARETVRQVTQAIRDGMDAGDDPVVILHNMAGSLSKESPFQTGGHGAAVFVTACFLLAESAYFDSEVVEAGHPLKPGPVSGVACDYMVDGLVQCAVDAVYEIRQDGHWPDPSYACEWHTGSMLGVPVGEKWEDGVWTVTPVPVVEVPESPRGITAEPVPDAALDAMVAEEFESWDREQRGEEPE